MAVTNVTLTSDSVIQVNSTAFGFRSGTFRITADDIDVSDNQSGIYKQRQAGHIEAEINVVMQAQSDVNPHSVAPLWKPLRTTASRTVKVYPWGLTVATYYQATMICLMSEWGAQDVHQPTQFTFSGKSTGTVYFPGDL